jgi:hypothetical protein
MRHADAIIARAYDRISGKEKEKFSQSLMELSPS